MISRYKNKNYNFEQDQQQQPTLSPNALRRPHYFNDLLRYPNVNPLCITADTHSLRFNHRLKGLCLYCNAHPDNYDLSFCYQREVWVLYSQPGQFAKAMSLAQAVQSSGAAKILLILVAN